MQPCHLPRGSNQTLLLLPHFQVEVVGQHFWHWESECPLPVHCMCAQEMKYACPLEDSKTRKCEIHITRFRYSNWKLFAEKEHMRSTTQLYRSFSPLVWNILCHVPLQYVVDILWYPKHEPGASVWSAGHQVIDHWGRSIPWSRQVAIIPRQHRFHSSSSENACIMPQIREPCHAWNQHCCIQANTPIFGTKVPISCLRTSRS